MALVPENAFYYPSLRNCIPVELHSTRFNASHDSGAICHENRHFLDVSLWRENSGVRLSLIQNAQFESSQNVNIQT